MKFLYSIKTAFTGLWTNKTRSVLTIFGILIGVTAIMLIVSLGNGAERLIMSQLEGLGSNTIVLLPGREPKGPTDSASLFLDSLKERDLNALKSKANVPYAKDIMPVSFGPVRLSYGNETYQSTILGGGSLTDTSLISRLLDIYPEKGSFFTSQDTQSKGSNIVIGSKVKEELFGNKEAVGEKIRVNNTSMRVAGVLPEKGQVSFFNFDDMILAPYTTTNQYILGRKHFDRIIISAEEESYIDLTVKDIEQTIRSTHNITDPEKDDFFVNTQADLVERLGVITSSFTIFLAAVASISLFVGGVGIMNIMLVSVTERTREIGLRKAVGATNKDILLQFLIEAVILTVLGGLIGIIVGSSLSYGASILINKYAGFVWAFVFPWGAGIIGILVSALIGLVFGLYPARRASKLSPIEALRYE